MKMPFLWLATDDGGGTKGGLCSQPQTHPAADMKLMGVRQAIYPKTPTTVANPEHRIYPHLLQAHLEIKT